MTALIFDIDDTLYDLAEPFYKAVRELFGEYNLPLSELFSSFRRHSDEVFDASERGEITMDDMYSYRISKALEDYGVKISRQEALAFQKLYQENQGKIALTDEMKDLLTRLSESGKCLGIISNGPSEHQRDKMRALGLGQWFHEPYILISGDVGVSKPDPEIFKIAEKKMNLKPEEAWFIGDTFANDVVGAAKAGWHTLWFNHRKREMPEGGPVPDRTAVNMEEFKEILLSL